MKPRFTLEAANLYIHYNPDTGEFRNNIANMKYPANSLLDTTHASGYGYICFAGYMSKRSHLAVLIMNGAYPVKGEQVDHINKIVSDDRWKNLRVCSQSENMRNTGLSSNNTSGVKGLYYKKDTNNWGVCLRTDKGRIQKLFEENEKDKAIAYLQAMRSLHHKEFTNHGTSEVITNV